MGGTDVDKSPGAHMERDRTWGAGLHWAKDSALPLSVITKSQCRLIRLLRRERHGQGSNKTETGVGSTQDI